MQIYINGEQRLVPEGLDLAALIEQLELTDRRIAVEVNEELVPRSSFAGQSLREADKVEIIHAVGGG